ncbi:MAG: MMPL family transporter [Methylococcales bacterium]
MPVKWRLRLYFLLLALAITVTFFIVRVKADLSTFFVTGTSTEEILLANEMQSGKLSRQYIASLRCDGLESAALTSFVNRFSDSVSKLKDVQGVWQPGQNQQLIDKLLPLYLPHASQIYSLEPEQYLSRLFTQEKLDQRAQLLKTSLLSLQGRRVKQIALQDPLLFTFSAFEDLTKFNQTTPKPSQDYITLIIESSLSGLAGAEQHQLQATLQALFTEQNSKIEIACTLEMTGVPIFAAATETMIKADIQRITIIASIGLVIVFLWIFRSLTALFWVSLVLLSAATGALLVTTLIYGYVHGLTLAIGTTLIGICVDYPIHAMVHASATNRELKEQAILKIWPSLLLGGITTIIGYTALGLSGYPGFQQIATYAGTGILISLLFTRFILPDLMTDRPVRSTVNLGMERWLNWCDNWHGLAILFVLVFATGAMFRLPSLQWIKDLSELTPEMDDLKAQDQRIRARFTSIEPGRFILVRGDDVESVLQKSETLYRLLDQLKDKDALASYIGLYPWLVSNALQKRNQLALDKYWQGNALELWHHALEKHGLSVRRLGDIRPQEKSHLQPHEILMSPASRLFSSQLVINDGRVMAMVWLAQHDPDSVRSAVNKLEGVSYFSQRDILNKLANDYRMQAVKMLFFGLSVIFLLLIIRYRSPANALRVLMPAVSAALFIMTGLSFLSIPLSFIHLVGFLLAVAVCVDYGIFFLENRSGNITLTYHAMAASMLTSAMAFGSLSMAENASLKALAVTVALGVVLGFLLCPIFIRPGQERISFADRH